MDTHTVKGTTFRNLPLKDRDKLLDKAAKENGRIKPGTGHHRQHDGKHGLGNEYNVFSNGPNLLTTKMAAPAGETLTYGTEGLTAVVWSPGFYANTVWATTPDRKFVHLRKRKNGSWFEDLI